MTGPDFPFRLTCRSDRHVITPVCFSVARRAGVRDIIQQSWWPVLGGHPGSKGETVRELYLLDSDDAEENGWQERALCAQTDPEAFFPEKGGSTREAKRVCLTCDVRGECLEYALQNDERFGIWGGLSERERRKLKKRAV